MRASKDQTQYQPLDLADQPKGQYLLRFQYGDGPSTVLWVDEPVEVTAHGSCLAYFNDAVVAQFHQSAQWFVIAASLVETFTNAEAIDRIYTGLIESEDTAARYRKLYEYRQGQTDPQPPRSAFLDDDDLRRLLGGEGD